VKRTAGKPRRSAQSVQVDRFLRGVCASKQQSPENIAGK
jgi:hypothetical protein